MSLPPATRDISNKPAAGAVTDPVNKQAKDADVDRKVRQFLSSSNQFNVYLLF
jgi:hypothetical protein